MRFTLPQTCSKNSVAPIIPSRRGHAPAPSPWPARQRFFTSMMMLSLLVTGATALTGCKHVSPWERGALADPVMRADRDPLGQMLAEHMWFSREAASGGRGVGGGGCGCN